MVQVVDYGTVPAARPQLTAKRVGFIRFAAVATLALGALAAVIVVGQVRPVELGMAPINEAGTGGYAVGDMGSTNNVDTLKNIWYDDTEAWEGIDEVLPTAGGAWEDQNEPDGNLFPRLYFPVCTVTPLLLSPCPSTPCITRPISTRHHLPPKQSPCCSSVGARAWRRGLCGCAHTEEG